VEAVAAVAAEQRVVAVAAGEGVVPGAGADRVVPAARQHVVVTVPGHDHVVAVGSHDDGRVADDRGGLAVADGHRVRLRRGCGGEGGSQHQCRRRAEAAEGVERGGSPVRHGSSFGPSCADGFSG